MTTDRRPPVEVVCPVRNGGEGFRRTLASLATVEYGGNLSLLISDNHSIDRATWDPELENLRWWSVRVISPVRPLDRVEHWSWALGRASADLVKPLMAGDRLEAGYFEALSEPFSEDKRLALAFCQLRVIETGRVRGPIPTLGFRRFTYRDFLEQSFKQMNFIGTLSAVLFARPHLQAALPLSATSCWTADWRLYSACLRRGPGFFVSEPLCAFDQSIPRFSTQPSVILRSLLEEWRFLAQLDPELPERSYAYKLKQRVKLVGWAATVKLGRRFLPISIRRSLARCLSSPTLR